MGIPVLIALVGIVGAQVPCRRDSDPSPMASIAHRMSDELPNPYLLDLAPPPDSLLPPDPPPLPTIQRDRRYFEMEDSGDRMGLELNRHVVVGLQVEFVGPAEDPRGSRKLIAIPHDPFHPIFLMPTAGVRVRF